ncbi:MAG: multicopper oxidase family protein [Chlamydiota bacterium]
MKRFLFCFFATTICFTTSVAVAFCEKADANATHLKVVQTNIEINGKSAPVYKIEVPGDSEALYKTEGDCFNVVVENHTSVPTTLHWHGLIDPVLEDGVAYVTQAPIPPGQSQGYNFKVVQAGTFWMHTHYGLQEQLLLSAPLILLPKEKSPHREIIAFFEGFTFKSIDEVWQNLRKEYVKKRKIEGEGWKPNLTPKMSKYMPNTLNDVNFDVFLTNRRSLKDPDVQIVEPGETVRLRLINGSVSSGLHIDLGLLEGEMIAVDGADIEPISHSHFPLAVAQRTDVLVKIPKEGGAFPIFAQSEGTNQRTGLILKTKDVKLPQFSSKARSTVGAISNDIEKELRAKDPLKPREVNRSIDVELQGNMKYYVWGINGHVWPNDEYLAVKEGERVELVFTNKTAMAHPMHLHGHVFEVVEIDGNRFSGAVRDTILVMPNQTVKVQFDANNPGVWALHCHISYHGWAGMFTVVKYEDYKRPQFPHEVIMDYFRRYGGY